MLRPQVKEVLVSKNFKCDCEDFDINFVVDCKHEYFTKLHKFEEKIDGNYIFRALNHHKHIVYCIDKDFRLIFLRVFSNFKEYKKFLEDKKAILKIIENC